MERPCKVWIRKFRDMMCPEVRFLQIDNLRPTFLEFPQEGGASFRNIQSSDVVGDYQRIFPQRSIGHVKRSGGGGLRITL